MGRPLAMITLAMRNVHIKAFVSLGSGWGALVHELSASTGGE